MYACHLYTIMHIFYLLYIYCTIWGDNYLIFSINVLDLTNSSTLNDELIFTSWIYTSIDRIHYNASYTDISFSDTYSYRSCPQLLNKWHNSIKISKLQNVPWIFFFLRNAETNHTQVFKNWKMSSALLSIKKHIQNPWNHFVFYFIISLTCIFFDIHLTIKTNSLSDCHHETD